MKGYDFFNDEKSEEGAVLLSPYAGVTSAVLVRDGALVKGVKADARGWSAGCGGTSAVLVGFNNAIEYLSSKLLLPTRPASS